MADKKLKVLLVEDDSMLVDMYSLKFDGEGFEVWKAGNGIEGLKALEEHGMPDIILLDVIMPQMDGFTMLQQLKSQAKFKDVPVILLTNLGQDNDVKRGMELGATDYLVKANLTPAQVVEKVHAILKK
jgi:two-component system phosphate regulon response regulator PhoB/two-component system alkaline phosphatase synthesis response regulator PhoP